MTKTEQLKTLLNELNINISEEEVKEALTRIRRNRRRKPQFTIEDYFEGKVQTGLKLVENPQFEALHQLYLSNPEAFKRVFAVKRKYEKTR